MNLILAQTLKQIHKILGDEAARLSVERVVVGLFFTGVKLNNGVCGISYTPLKSFPQAVCCPSQAAVMPHSDRIFYKRYQQSQSS